MKICGLVLALLLFSFETGAAQERMGAHGWGSWGPTVWNVLTFRVKCDGSVPPAGPIPTRWRMEIRNSAKEMIYLDYAITFLGDQHAAAKPRRISIKPASSKEVATDLNTDCEGQVTTRVTNVRLGRDADDVPYLPPDNPGSD